MSEETLLKFPCQFPIKAMGRADIEFDLLVLEIIRQHLDVSAKTKMTSRASRNGKYVSVTVEIEATSKQQLDAVYQQLSAHPAVLMTL